MMMLMLVRVLMMLAGVYRVDDIGPGTNLQNVSFDSGVAKKLR